MRPLPLLPAALGLLLSLPFVGYADAASGWEAVSGHVRFQGRPLDQGTIQFLPWTARTRPPAARSATATTRSPAVRA